MPITKLDKLFMISGEPGGQIISIFCSSEYDLKYLLDSLKEPQKDAVIKSEDEISNLLTLKNYVSLLKPNKETITGLLQ